MHFIKSHGLGNDYLVLTSGDALDAEQVRKLCDRHTGIGSDGVLEPRDSQVADFGLRIWNPDGSEAEKSGNGLRIFAKWIRDHRGAPDAFSVEVPAGVVQCQVGELDVTVEMGAASFVPSSIPATCELKQTPVKLGEHTLLLNAVGMGNPHCVVFVDTDPDGFPWREWGEKLENSPFFPNRTNVQIVHVVHSGLIDARVWERGAGETMASGSSACAIVAVAYALGRCDAEVRVEMPGGALSVRVNPGFEMVLEGPVQEVASIQIATGFLA